MIDPRTSPNALALASGAVLASLLDTLVASEVLTVGEVTRVLQSAMTTVNARANSAEAFEGSQLITALMRHFSERA
jgi:hypothetical protein